MSTRDSIFYGEDENRRSIHIYWELADRDFAPKFAAPIDVEIQADGNVTIIRLPRELATRIADALIKDRTTDVL